MSLLQKASIITTPTAYAEDYLYSIKPAYALGTELVTNGTFDTDSNWTKGTGWTISGGVASCSGGSANLTQSVSATVGTTYRVSFTITAYNSGAIRTTFNTISSQDYNSVGTFVDFFKITSITSGQILLDPRGTFDGSIDNVSVKEVTDADFDFDRNSTGTRVNEDYLIEDVPYNLVDYSQDFTNSSWTKNNATVTSDNTISPDGAGGCSLYTLNSYTGDNQFLRINPNTTFASGLAHSYSLFVKYNSFQYVKLAFINYGTSQYFAAIFDIINGTVTDTKNQFASNTNASIETAGNGWYRIKITASLTSSAGNAMNYEFNKSTGATPTYGTYGRISQTTTTSDKVFIWGGQLVKGDQPKDYLKTTDRLDIPRIDYTNGEPSILLETSRTNLIPHSGDFSNSSYIRTATTATGGFLSPEGNLNAYKLSEDSTNSIHRIYQTATVTSSPNATISVYVKYNGRRFVLMRIADVTVGRWYDLLSGELGGIYAGTPNESSIEPLANGWYRITIGHTVSSQSRFELWIQDTESISAYQGDGTSGIYIYGAQQEVGSYATSLIHTSGSAVTRSADAANNAGNSDLINSTEGVLYAEIKALADDLTFRTISLSDGTTPNSIRIYYNNVSNSIVFAFFLSGAVQSVYTASVSDITEFHKVAYKYKANDFSVFVDGRQVHTDTSGSVFSANTLNSLQFNSGAGSERIYGDVKSVMVFKEALTDLELEKLTGYNNHELYMNYYNRLSYLGLAEEYNVESDINNYIL